MRKLLTILILLFAFITPTYAETAQSDVTSKIQYDSKKDQILVSHVALKCGDYYYGVAVKDGINFNNVNNYFTTSSGLIVAITNEKLKSGVNKNNGYQSIQELEKGVFLIVNGPDETTVNKVFKNVYKTPETAYRMFDHNISSEWTKEVIITPTVVSFSNGSNTIYIYQNQGSISEGSYKGKIQPTVFMKELRGIDIPITYPEDVKDLKNYVPYGTQRYERYVTNGFTPYAAYDDKAGYIILAKDHDTLKDLFEQSSKLSQPVSEITVKTRSAKQFDFEPDTYNLDEVMDYAKDVINSDNRYHFGVVQKGDGKQTEYYSEVWGLEDEMRANGGIDDDMGAVFVRPSIKTVNYAYNTHSYLNKEMSPIKTDAMLAKDFVIITNHGAWPDLISFVNGIGILSMNQYQEFMLEGDYGYLFDDEYLKIYRHTFTDRAELRYGCSVDEPNCDYPAYQEWDNYLNQHYTNGKASYSKKNDHDMYSYSCSNITGINSLYQQYKLNSKIKY